MQLTASCVRHFSDKPITAISQFLCLYFSLLFQFAITNMIEILTVLILGSQNVSNKSHDVLY